MLGKDLKTFFIEDMGGVGGVISNVCGELLGDLAESILHGVLSIFRHMIKGIKTAAENKRITNCINALIDDNGHYFDCYSSAELKRFFNDINNDLKAVSKQEAKDRGFKLIGIHRKNYSLCPSDHYQKENIKRRLEQCPTYVAAPAAAQRDLLDFCDNAYVNVIIKEYWEKASTADRINYSVILSGVQDIADRSDGETLSRLDRIESYLMQLSSSGVAPGEVLSSKPVGFSHIYHICDHCGYSGERLYYSELAAHGKITSRTVYCAACDSTYEAIMDIAEDPDAIRRLVAEKTEETKRAIAQMGKDLAKGVDASLGSVADMLVGKIDENAELRTEEIKHAVSAELCALWEKNETLSRGMLAKSDSIESLARENSAVLGNIADSFYDIISGVDEIKDDIAKLSADIKTVTDTVTETGETITRGNAVVIEQVGDLREEFVELRRIVEQSIQSGGTPPPPPPPPVQKPDPEKEETLSPAELKAREELVRAFNDYCKELDRAILPLKTGRPAEGDGPDGMRLACAQLKACLNLDSDTGKEFDACLDECNTRIKESIEKQANYFNVQRAIRYYTSELQRMLSITNDERRAANKRRA